MPYSSARDEGIHETADKHCRRGGVDNSLRDRGADTGTYLLPNRHAGRERHRGEPRSRNHCRHAYPNANYNTPAIAYGYTSPNTDCHCGANRNARPDRDPRADAGPKPISLAQPQSGRDQVFRGRL